MIIVSNSANSRYRAVPGNAMSDKVANSTAEIAVVGPEIITIDDPQRAAITAVTMAV